MIMQHFDSAKTYKEPDLNIDMKIHKKLKKPLHKYNICFTIKNKISSNFYGLPKIYKSEVLEAAIHSKTQR